MKNPFKSIRSCSGDKTLCFKLQLNIWKDGLLRTHQLVNFLMANLIFIGYRVQGLLNARSEYCSWKYILFWLLDKIEFIFSLYKHSYWGSRISKNCFRPNSLTLLVILHGKTKKINLRKETSIFSYEEVLELWTYNLERNIFPYNM